MTGRSLNTHSARRVVARLLVAVLAAGLLGIPATHPARAATATVGNGITTKDLNAIGMSPTALATDLMGTGVTGIANVTFTGANAQAGSIDLLDPAVVSFNHGVILSSGNIADVVGPNKSEGTTGVMTGNADADLTALIAGSATVNPMTYDAAVLEFDFTPNASTVYFTYVFGSDEYLEWVNLFNDVFAFYVGTGPTRANCATVGGGSPVSIDTINSTVNPASYRDNSFISPPASPINIESDGLSVELICQAAVTPGVPNHIKLAIADTSDQILDSVVLLKAASLSTTPPESCNNGYDDNADTLVDMNDPLCQASTTPPPPGGGGIGTGNSGPPFTGNEGDAIALDAAALGWTATPDALTTSWTVTGINGTPGTCDIVEGTGTQPVGAAGAIAVVHAVCPNEGEYAARVDGWDVEAKGAFDKDVDFFVHNAPPSVAITSPVSGSGAAIGETVLLSSNVADPGLSDTVTCAVDWGDGSSSSLAYDSIGHSCNGDHSYSSAGEKLITLTATDNSGASAATATVVAITDGTKFDQTITWNAAPPVTAQYGDQFTVAASGGASGSDVIFGSSGGCTNSGADFTMTSSTVACGVTADQAGNGSYNAATQVTESVTATTRAITATADPQTKHAGDLDPALTYQITSGSLAGLDTLTGELARDAGETLGAYDITQGTLAATADYVLTYVGALLTITDGTAPTAHAPTATIRSGVALSGTAIPVTVWLTGHDDAGGSQIDHYLVAASTTSCASGFGADTYVHIMVPNTTWNTSVNSSGSVCFRSVAVDGADNPSAPAYSGMISPRLTQQNSSAVRYLKTWSTTSGSKYSGGSEKFSSVKNAAATFTVSGKAVAVVVTRGLARGKVKIYVDGVLKTPTALDLRNAKTQYRWILWQTTLTAGSHKVKVVVQGTAGRPRVDLDAFAVLK